MTSRRTPTDVAIVVTAEHGGNRVPARYRELFRGHDGLLASHRGWDAGTLDLSARLARRWRGDRVAATATRLLVDLNRSAHNPHVFSEITRGLGRSERDTLLERWHRPHRDRVRQLVEERASRGSRVLHVAVHSFTPLWKGMERGIDLSLLYDPARAGERALARGWTRAMKRLLPSCSIRRNVPYRGLADGLTTWLRELFPVATYLGIEVEVSQRHLCDAGRFPTWVERALVEGLDEVAAAR